MCFHSTWCLRDKVEYKFSLTVIGEGKFKNDYVEMSKKLGIRDKINFKNYMSNQKELIKFYKLRHFNNSFFVRGSSKSCN